MWPPSEQTATAGNYLLLPALLYSLSLSSFLELGTISEKEVRRREIKIYVITSLERTFIMDPATCSPWWPTAVPRTVQLISYVSEQVFGIQQNK